MLNEPLRHHDGDGALTAESASELGEDGPGRRGSRTRTGREGARGPSPTGEAGKAVMRPIDQVRAELDAEFRTGAEIAARLGMSITVVGGPLGTLRRRGEGGREARTARRELVA